MAGRLAPTPSGDLHLGNALAFVAAWLSARSKRKPLWLRVEDVDRQRSRPQVEAALREDLAWLGLDWDRETPRQSGRDYAWALSSVSHHTYRCRCTRKVLAPFRGRYPGTCREAGHGVGALRFRLPPGVVGFQDEAQGGQRVDPIARFGDPVLVRRDGNPTYLLAVVADDMADGITEVVRGADLLEHTATQIQLHRALGNEPPTWTHVPVVVDPSGRKLDDRGGEDDPVSIMLGGACRRRSSGRAWRVRC